MIQKRTTDDSGATEDRTGSHNDRGAPFPRSLVTGRDGTVQPLCAICATRPGTELDRIDDRLLVICKSCHEDEVPEPRVVSTRERILRVLRRSDGLDIVELAQALGEDDELGRAKLCAALIRAKKAGLVTYSGGKMDRVYRLSAARRRGRAKAS